MGTFSTNRIYTVGRVVKVVDRTRLGACSRAGSIPSVSRMQNSSETQILMARLWTSSRAYYCYIWCSMIVGCGVDGRVPSFDLSLLTGAVALWFMVASYSPWSEQRRAYVNRPPIGGVFALCILGRLMASILEQSGVEFGVCLVDIMCNFPGLPLHVVLCQSHTTLYVHTFNKLKRLRVSH